MNTEARTDGLVDISTVKIDQSLSKDEKAVSFVRQTNYSPYCFISGKYVVTSSFDMSAPTLESNIKRFID